MRPLIKWVGGKSRSANHIIQHFPPGAAFDRYMEPFLGGGAMYWEMRSRYGTSLQYSLADSNTYLVNFNRVVRDSPIALKAASAAYADQHSETFYKQVRANLPDLTDLTQQAASFWYLNQAGFNGLWRENKAGALNTPWGKRSVVVFKECLAHSDALQGTSVEVRDFEESLDAAGPKTLVYCDPPYLAKGFRDYRSGGFNFEQHDRLLAAAVRATDRGATVFISNSDDEFTRSLYEGHLIFNMSEEHRIAADPAKRGTIGSLLLKVVPS